MGSYFFMEVNRRFAGLYKKLKIAIYRNIKKAGYFCPIIRCDTASKKVTPESLIWPY